MSQRRRPAKGRGPSDDATAYRFQGARPESEPIKCLLFHAQGGCSRSRSLLASQHTRCALALCVRGSGPSGTLRPPGCRRQGPSASIEGPLLPPGSRQGSGAAARVASHRPKGSLSRRGAARARALGGTRDPLPRPASRSTSSAHVPGRDAAASAAASAAAAASLRTQTDGTQQKVKERGRTCGSSSSLGVRVHHGRSPNTRTRRTFFFGLCCKVSPLTCKYSNYKRL